MDYLINLALGVIGSLIAAEIVFHHKRWCQRIIRSAAARIKDQAHSAVKLEEWLAALDEHVGVIASFSHSIGCWFGAPAVASELKLPVAKRSGGKIVKPAAQHDRERGALRAATTETSRTLGEAAKLLSEMFADPMFRRGARSAFIEVLAVVSVIAAAVLLFLKYV